MPMTEPNFDRYSARRKEQETARLVAEHYQRIRSQAEESSFSDQKIDIEDSSDQVFKRAWGLPPQPVRGDFSKNIAGAKEAIDQVDLTKLKLNVGPSIYGFYQRLSRSTNENYWVWLKAKLKLYFLQKKYDFLYNFAKDHNFPNQLNETQASVLSDDFGEKFKLIKDAQMELICPISPQMKPLAKQYLESLFKEEVDKIKKISNLPVAFYQIEIERKNWEAVCQNKKEEQERLNQKDKPLLVWEDFKKEIQPSANMDEKDLDLAVAKLQKNGIADLSLDGEVFGSLFDYAVNKYVNCDENDKRRVLPLIKCLLEHGCMPSSNCPSLDWTLLQLALQHMETRTPFSENLRKKLLTFSRETQAVLVSWVYYWFTNTTAKDFYRGRVAGLIQENLQNSNKSGVEIDTRLASSIAQLKGNSFSLDLVGPDLFAQLKQVVENANGGKIVAPKGKLSLIGSNSGAPVIAVEPRGRSQRGTEMIQMKGYGATSSS